MHNPAFRWIRKTLLAFMAVVFCAGFGGLEQSLAPKAELWPRWQAHDANNKAVIDHRAWDGLLKRYIKPGAAGVNLFAYGAVTSTDKKTLGDYLVALEKTPISRFSRREQLAYWINFYNALTVKIVLDHYPVDSIKDIDISPGFFASGPWDKKLVRIEGEPVSLNDIEHRILRPIWRDPRIHYAVNCASIGCPNLQMDAYTGANTERLLDLGAEQYINSPRGVKFDGDEAVLSKIYNWFQSDFGETAADVLGHLRNYAKPQLKQKLQKIEDVSNFVYDWTLNDVPH